RVKGDIVDIFIPYDDYPVRIEYWGDEIERISYIEPLTGYKISETSGVEIFPSKNFVFDSKTINLAAAKIREELEQTVERFTKDGKLREAERLKQRTEYDLEMLLQVGYCKGMENYSVYFEGRGHGEPPYTLLDYFPDDYLLFIDESHITVPQVGGMYNGDLSRKINLVEYGFRMRSALDNRPLKFEEFKNRTNQLIYVSATPKEYEIENSKQAAKEVLK